MYVHIIVVITCRGRVVTNVGRTCGPTPLLTIYAIKYVYTKIVIRVDCLHIFLNIRFFEIFEIHQQHMLKLLKSSYLI